MPLTLPLSASSQSTTLPPPGRPPSPKLRDVLHRDLERVSTSYWSRAETLLTDPTQTRSTPSPDATLRIQSVDDGAACYWPLLACNLASWLLGCCTHSNRQVRIWQARNKVPRFFLGSRHGGYWSRVSLMDCCRFLAGTRTWLAGFGAAALQACRPLLAPLQQPNEIHTVQYPRNLVF
jgi:hypothetical protein